MKPILSALLALAVFADLTIVATTSKHAVRAVYVQNQDVQKKTHSRYAVTALSTLGGYLSTASGINNKGWVVGDANLAGNSNEHATLWRDGVITDLSTLGGPNSSIGFIRASPNDRGLITGNAQSSTGDPLEVGIQEADGLNAAHTKGICS